MVTIEEEAKNYLKRKGIRSITIEAHHPVHSCCGEFCFEPAIRLEEPVNDRERYDCYQQDEIQIFYHRDLPQKHIIIEKQFWGLFNTLHIKNWKLF